MIMYQYIFSFEESMCWTYLTYSLSTIPRILKNVSSDSFYSSLFFTQVLPMLSTRLSTTPLQMIYNLPTSVRTFRFLIEISTPQSYTSKEFNVLRFESLSTHEEVTGIDWDPDNDLSKTTHEGYHPSPSTSTLVSR
jgi:hypothetical protein